MNGYLGSCFFETVLFSSGLYLNCPSGTLSSSQKTDKNIIISPAFKRSNLP